MSGRKQKSAKNIISGLLSKIIVFIFAFMCRTVFVRSLGAEYTGINGLYSNILTVLALADLGIGNVFSFSLYKYIAEDNRKKLTQLINTFKKLYCIIGFSIFGVGLLIVPFLQFIVKSTLSQSSVVIYYILYLINSAASYFFVYKTTLLVADQKQYINNLWTTITQCVMYGMQICYVLLFKDFIGFLIIQIICTIGKNIIISIIADKHYPYIKEKTSNKSTSEELNGLWKNIKATFIYKICTIALNNTDNILISIILGTIVVGFYSNYYMLIQYIAAYVFILTSGLHASVGNYQTNHSTEESYSLFKTLNLVYASIACIIVSAFISCIQEFIPIWVGKEYIIDIKCVIAILLVLYIDVIMSPITLYRETLGLFKQVQYIMIPAAVVNIILSIILGNIIGLTGIVLSTSVSKLLTNFWYEPYILYRHFKCNCKQYFYKQTKYLTMTVLAVVGTYLACRIVSTGVLGIAIRIMISLIVSTAFIILFNFSDSSFKALLEMLKPIIHKRRKI